MSAVRRLVEIMSRNRVLAKRLPEDLGGSRILVSPDAALSFWKPGVESDLFDFAREFVGPGSIVWDLGANVGLFTFAAAYRAGTSGRVIAIEPDVWLAGLLRRSLALQHENVASTQILPAAVSDSSSIAELCIANRGRASNYLKKAGGSTQTGGLRSINHVVTITLDWLLDQGAPPTVLKIDVEGAELPVLTGAARVLNSARPTILCEVYPSHTDEVTRLLFDHGYELYNWEAKERKQIQRATFHTLALPR